MFSLGYGGPGQGALDISRLEIWFPLFLASAELFRLPQMASEPLLFLKFEEHAVPGAGWELGSVS